MGNAVLLNNLKCKVTYKEDKGIRYLDLYINGVYVTSFIHDLNKTYPDIYLDVGKQMYILDLILAYKARDDIKIYSNRDKSRIYTISINDKIATVIADAFN